MTHANTLSEGDFAGAIALGRAALAVSCPDCGARPGVICKRPSGHSTKELHGARRREADRAFFATFGPSARIAEDLKTIVPGAAPPVLAEGWQDDPVIALQVAEGLFIPGLNASSSHKKIIALIQDDLILRGVTPQR